MGARRKLGKLARQPTTAARRRRDQQPDGEECEKGGTARGAP